MKKIILPIVLFIMFIPIFVNAEDKLTITYDSNDNSGRTKIVELDKGDSYTVLGNDIFLVEENSNDNPMDDKIIESWCKNKDCSGGKVGLYNTYTYKPNPLNSWENDNYNFFNDLSEITLYAKWNNRKNIINMLQDITVSGEGVIEKENGDYEIEKNKDFEIIFKFKEKPNYQLSQLSFYELPTYFTSILTEEMKTELEKETNLPIKIDSGELGIETFNGKFYVKNNILFVDFIEDGTIGSKRFYSATNVGFRITYKVTYREEKRNTHTFYSTYLSFKINDAEEKKVIIYPKGKIITKYIDLATGKSIIPDSIKTDILGEIYNPKEISIDGYKLVEKPVNKEYEFDEEQQVIYYKYQNLLDRKDGNTNQKEKDINVPYTLKNPYTGLGISMIIIIMLIISSITYITIKEKKCKVKKEQFRN